MQEPIVPKYLLLAGAPVEVDHDYPFLKGAIGELESIAARFSATQKISLTGRAATPSAFDRRDLPRFSLIHIAAHAVTNQESPLNSAIILSPGKGGGDYKLYAYKLASMKLRANLVTLSACRGAGSRPIPGEGLVGLSWALLRAGAQNVIAGLWSVQDASTADLMAALYDHLKRGENPSLALHSAKLDLMAKTPQYGAPYYWAAFQIYSR
jgi:CHAT domain-containing protein